jgi:hypothetical protein
LSMNDPSPWDKFLYLAGKRAAPEHRAWLNNLLQNTEPHKRGAIFAVPGSLILGTFGLLIVFINGLGSAAIMLVGAVVIPVISSVPAFSRRRVMGTARRNGLPAPDNW